MVFEVISTFARVDDGGADPLEVFGVEHHDPVATTVSERNANFGGIKSVGWHGSQLLDGSLLVVVVLKVWDGGLNLDTNGVVNFTATLDEPLLVVVVLTLEERNPFGES